MRTRLLRQLLAWGFGLSLYALLVTVVFESLEESSIVNPPAENRNPPLLQEDAGRMEVLLKGVAGGENIEGGVLLPVGPKEGLLPGAPEVWRELLKAREFVGQTPSPEGFDGQQTVGKIEEFTRGSTAELLLSGQPKQVLRFGSALYLLNSNKRVEIIDCSIPEQPEIVDTLAYFPVRSLAVMDNVAFLLISQHPTNAPTLVALDLNDPLHPKEVALHKLPKEAVDIKILGAYLAVYSKPGGRKDRTLYLYEFSDDHRLSFLRTIESPSFERDSLGYGKFQFVKDTYRGIKVYDFEKSMVPDPVAVLNIPNKIKRMAIYGNRLFAWSDVGRFYVFDISNPAASELLTVVDEAGHSAYLLFVESCTYYFCENSYLRVFPRLPSPTLEGSENRLSATVVGELVPLVEDGGFTLVGPVEQVLPDAVKAVLPLQNSSSVVDALQWQQLFVVLNVEGRLQLFRLLSDSDSELLDTLQLEPGQRWLAAGSNQLYVGGGSSIQAFSLAADGRLRCSGFVQLDVADTWDGVVTNDVLSVAAGKAGLLSFPLGDNDQLLVGPSWSIPKQLAPQIDLRQLAATCDGRIFAAAGDAGLVSGKVENDGRFTLTGHQYFAESVRAVAVTAGLCLVSTGRGVAVIDIRSTGTIQKLGLVELAGVERLVVAPPDYWAGFIPGEGWNCLPTPRLLLPKEETSSETVSLALPTRLSGKAYRLNLFNRNGITAVHGLISMPQMSHVQAPGSAYDAD